MGRKANVSEEEIYAACDALLGQGQRPTIERVRQALGRGSPNFVNRVLDAWWASLAARMRKTSEQTTPPALLELCNGFYGRLRSQAFADAQAEATAMRMQLDAEAQTMEQGRAQLGAERAGVARVVESLREELAAHGTQSQASADRIRVLEVELASERHRGEEALRQAQKAQEERERAETKTIAELDRQRGRAQSAEDRWLREIDRLREEAKRQRTEQAASRKQFEGRIQVLQLHLAEATRRANKLEKKVDLVERRVQAPPQARKQPATTRFTRGTRKVG